MSSSNGGTGNFASATLTVASSGVDVSGSAYADVNHSGVLDAGENGSGLTLYVKLVPRSGGTCTGPASAAVAAAPASGAYTLPGVSAGDYCLVLDDNNSLADITASLPAGWLRTEAATGVRQITVVATPLSSQNFGLYNGSVLTGRVFRDTGVGAGVPNNAVQDGSEPGIAGVTVRATDSGGGTTFDSTVTDGAGNYTLWIAASAGANPIRVVQANAGGFVSTGGQPGTTTGAYLRSSDVTTFTNVVGSSYSGVNFADVPDNALTSDGAQSALPGATLNYAHSFTAGSGGSVSFATSAVASPALTGWSEVLYRDANCNGVLDGAEGATALSGPLIVTAGELVCVLVKEFVPATAPNGAQNQVTLTASFSYSNASPALASTHTRSDLTTVGAPGSAGLTLIKSVDKATALPGEVLTYTIVYTNNSSGALSTLRISDGTPAFTTFASAACIGALPANLSSCSVSSAPAAGATGSIDWSFVGTLAPGGSGTVRFAVTVNP